METRNEKFRRLSEARMTKVFSILNILRNQSDKSKYSFSESDIEELFGALEQKGEEIKEFFTSPITIKTVNLRNTFQYSTINKNNDKEVSFKKLSTARVEKIFSLMNLLANLSNKSNYNYNDWEVEELFSAYDDEVKKCKIFFEERRTIFRYSK
ncbi:TPA: hypothetical protein VB967_002211 [Streptococcus suis]|uniref:hypothetical protein n=1 Tax=Streptococcus suis TaxID=1307 RepID=UPI0024128ED5|nr:hypothetical protein [Streptococcus suis]HEL0028825.1 hypothetical protein [Streptococcus equi subsp. zooepidemicus]MDG4497577.1 hypothetical protein [Streptococcus suis]HEM3992065.1 hypothetical protein [Streptococcus suis]HEM3997736.1 hypothetical protein [Streptococcus suis]HEM3999659.1 hypothetical protein [Streptococcus suis]